MKSHVALAESSPDEEAGEGVEVASEKSFVLSLGGAGCAGA